MPIRPMLAATLDGKGGPTIEDISFPVLASPKIDGIRVLVTEEGAQTRSGKLLRCPTVHELLKPLVGLDGEAVFGPPNAPDTMQRSMRLTSPEPLTAEEQARFSFWVFDRHDMPGETYANRLRKAYEARYALGKNTQSDTVPHVWIDSPEALADYEAHVLSLGYEGVMLNDPAALYKNGRSTKKSLELVKVKRYADAEAVVVGVLEMMHNDNEIKASELGFAKRSTKKEGKRAAGTLGKLVCRNFKDGEILGPEFEIGCFLGVTAEDKARWWAEKESLLGTVCTYKHFAVTGVKERPRQPVFKSWRSRDDL